MPTISEFEQSIYTECKVDFVPLSEIPHSIEIEQPSLDSRERRTLSLEIARRLLNREDILAGTIGKDGQFIALKLPGEELIALVSRQWDALGHDPLPGDILWFSSKEFLASGARMAL